MYLHYGGWTSDAYEVTWTVSRTVVMNEADQPYATRHTWQINGQLQAADTAALLTARTALETAFAYWNRDLWVTATDGTVVESLPLAGSLRGVRVTSPPSYPRGDGAQLSTFRDYSITVEAEYPGTVLGGVTFPLKSFTETVAYSGGGPKRAVVECVNAPPQEQVVMAYTAYRAAQTGSAVGLLGYPPVPPPLWPDKLEEAGQPTLTAPRLANGVYTEFGVAWSYRFVSAGPLVGFPNRWPAG